MRVAGTLSLDGSSVKLDQGGNHTLIQSNAPSGDITLTLPATTDTLVGRATTDTLTNKTLTSPKINEDVVLTATATELNQLDGVTVGGTTAGDIATIDGTQTLTGKTIVAASNTITTAASGNLASTELNAALAELQGSIDVRVLTTTFDAHVSDFDTHTLAINAHGVSGAIVGTTSLQTLTNKTLTNPKINDTIALSATSTELNYVSGVTSAIQTQLDSKQATLTTGTSAQYLKGDLTLGTFATDVAATAAVAANTAKTYDSLAPTTTKGDLSVHDGTNNIRLPVGSDGQVLSADSLQASGLAWTSPLTNPMTTAGDLIVGGASGAATRTGIGSTDQVLTVVAGVPSWRTGVKGVTDGSSASAGYIGEVVTGSKVRSAATSLTSATAERAASITLEAGDWDISASIGFNCASSTTVTQILWSINRSASSTISGVDTRAVPDSNGDYSGRFSQASSAPGGDMVFTVPQYRVSLASQTTFYLIGQASFAVSTCSLYGFIQARRVR